MLRERLLTAAGLIALFVSLILFSPPWVICIVVDLLVLLASWEYFALTSPGQAKGDRLLCLLLALPVPVAFFSGRPHWMAGSLFLPLFVLSIRSLFGAEDLKARLDGLLRTLFGIFYVSFCLSHFVLLRNLEEGKLWIFAILLVTYLGDGAAYFSGSTLGSRKLSPRLSPKKTVEGAVGGVLGSILAMFLCKWFFFSSLSNLEVLGFASVLAVSGQLGDLVESLIKRSVGVKDSGKLLPGHGGILDRVDSVLLAGPVGYYLALALQKG